MSEQPVVDPPPMNLGVAIQHAVHGAVRRDLDRLVVATGSDGSPTAAVQDYSSEFLFQLHHHHTLEDDSVWPLMRERLGSRVTVLLDRNLAEHADIMASVDAFSGRIDDLDADRDAAHAAAIHMRDVVALHLGHEEADVIPLIPEAFTLEDFARFQEESGQVNPPNRFLPWLLEGAPEARASAFKGNLPDPVREQLETSWMPIWQAKVDAL